MEGLLLSEAQNPSLAGHAWPTAYFLIPSTALHLTALVKQSRASSIRSVFALNANGSQGVRGGVILIRLYPQAHLPYEGPFVFKLALLRKETRKTGLLASNLV